MCGGYLVLEGKKLVTVPLKTHLLRISNAAACRYQMLLLSVVQMC